MFRSIGFCILTTIFVVPVCNAQVNEVGMDGFRSGLRKAIREAKDEGAITRHDARRLRLAMFSPAFLANANFVARTQVLNHEGGDPTEVRDWDEFFSAAIEFLKALLPILLELLPYLTGEQGDDTGSIEPIPEDDIQPVVDTSSSWSFDRMNRLLNAGASR